MFLSKSSMGHPSFFQVQTGEGGRKKRKRERGKGNEKNTMIKMI